VCELLCAYVADEFSIEAAQDGDATVIHVRGEIDIATCERLRDAIEPHLGPQQTIILDLSGVAFMDSSSLPVLLHARSTLTADGGSLVLRNPSVAARRLLTIAGVQHLLQADADRHAPDSS
jgi:anti-sigma B factor antagonist